MLDFLKFKRKSAPALPRAAAADVFSYSDVLGEFSVFDFLGVVDNGRFFEMPVSLVDLERLLRSGVHHASAIYAKINILKVTFTPTRFLSRSEFEKFAFNYLVLGNGYLEIQRNRFGVPVSVQNRLAMYMRRASNLQDFVYLRYGSGLGLGMAYDEIAGEDVIHVMQPNLKQEVYGLPYYLAALDSVDLNAAATRFRVRYYQNGSHAGFILYSTDAKIDEEGWANIKEQLRQAKGNGNFKNIVIRSPDGSPDGLKLIPIAEVAAKDDFLNIKTISAEDMMAIHRVPPALMGVVPKNTSGLGDAETVARVFATNEVKPLQQTFLDINERVDLELFKFDDYVIAGAQH